MLIRVISNYLQTNKRLVVPQLGAFLVKQPTREVFFSELIRRDDGVLRALLVEAGLSELVAQGEIDRFVFEVRHALEEGRKYPLERFGRLFAGANATICFQYDPTTQVEPEAEVATETADDEQPTERVAQPAAELQSPPQKSVVERAKGPAEKPVETEEQPARQTDERATAPATEPTDEPATQEEAEVEQREQRPRLTESAKMHPAPYVKGLSYGKPPKNTDAFTYVDRPQRRRKVDSFLLVAIIAAVMALGAIAYGFYHEQQERRAEEASIERLEALFSTDTPAEEAGTTDPSTNDK